MNTKKKAKKLVITAGILGLMMFTGLPTNTIQVQAAEVGQTQQVKQLSPRWYEQNGIWYLKNEQGTGNVTNSWFEDCGDWYLLARGDGRMYAGLVHDTITDRWYMLNTEHDGTYGRMFCTDGIYTVNGKEVYLTFNQSHDGTFGAITSGLDNLKSTGVYTEEIDGIAIESADNADVSSKTTESADDSILRDVGLTREDLDRLMEEMDQGLGRYGNLH